MAAANFAFLGQFATRLQRRHLPPRRIFCSYRNGSFVYGLMGVDRGVPEVWGSVLMLRELLVPA
ncbi:MAG: hypothetical protein ACLTER_23885 [Ruminococcus sp.]